MKSSKSQKIIIFLIAIVVVGVVIYFITKSKQNFDGKVDCPSMLGGIPFLNANPNDNCLECSTQNEFLTCPYGNRQRTHQLRTFQKQDDYGNFIDGCGVKDYCCEGKAPAGADNDPPVILSGYKNKTCPQYYQKVNGSPDNCEKISAGSCIER